MSLPVVHLEAFLRDPKSEESIRECQKAAEALKTYGTLIVRDPRVTQSDNSDFIDMVEDYFALPDEVKEADARPDLFYQVGPTPEFKEFPKCGRDPACQDIIAQLPQGHRPLPVTAEDPKWRYFVRYGERPKQSEFEELNAPNIVPKGFPTWPAVMDKWGGQMHRAVSNIAEMVAIGLGLERDAITNLTQYGPHLLAPTASDLNKYGKVDTVLAGFHYDLNLLTIHGKSRFPGLYIWPRNTGERMLVRVPDGCLLVQAGKEMEWLTGGAILAGYHEVVVTPDTLKAVERQKMAERPLWRVSSTFFYHVASDQTLVPLLPSDHPEKYPPVKCGAYVQKELEGIKLKTV